MALNLSQDFSSYYCNCCDINCRKRYVYEKHLLTSKHKINEKCHKSAWEKIPNPHIFSCDICNYSCGNKKDYNKHLLTSKHNEALIPHGKNPKTHMCQNCGKNYATQSGLWRHNQKCIEEKEFKNEENETENETDTEQFQTQQPLNNVITPELIMMLIEQNKEMQKMMFELAKNGGHNTTNNNIQNNHNKAFNMNFFLNETCKNAMNMSEFVRNLVVTTDDFEQTGILGYVEGISRILENGLKKLDVHERPIHCSDLKRETIYIKDNDKWEKDDDNKTKLLGVIKQIGVKNINMIPQWQKEHPGWSDYDSKENDRYLKYVFNSMCGGTTQEINHNYGKIMRNISRITIVDKQEALNSLM